MLLSKHIEPVPLLLAGCEVILLQFLRHVVDKCTFLRAHTSAICGDADENRVQLLHFLA